MRAQRVLMHMRTAGSTVVMSAQLNAQFVLASPLAHGLLRLQSSLQDRTRHVPHPRWTHAQLEPTQAQAPQETASLAQAEGRGTHLQRTRRGAANEGRCSGERSAALCADLGCFTTARTLRAVGEADAP